MSHKHHLDRKSRLTLTLLFTGVVLCFFLLTLFVVAAVIFVLVKLDLLAISDSPQRNATNLILIFAGASAVLGAIMTFFLSRFPLEPVNILINRMNRLASGDYKARLDVGELWRKNSTVAEIEQSFNRMASELDGTELLRADFINNFSHEFKTPIVSIAGFAKLLKRGNLNEEQKAEYLDIIETESLRLSQMATNVLNLTKVENQAILTDVTCYNLSEQIRSCILLLEPKWEKKKLDFSVEFDEYSISANKELLQQVWINLLDNAIKFSDEYGTVEVTLQAQHGGIVVGISNFGPAIPMEERKRIFHKFYQTDRSHATEGNGVGLAIVRQVVELHGGTVTVDCDRGRTTFTVCLPNHTS